MRDDGSGQVPLTSPSGGEYDSHPSICPTGREVYFDRYSGGQTDIWKINGDGTGLTQITNTPNESEEDPDCGSNGLYSYVVFTKTDVTGAGDVYRMNLDGSNVDVTTCDPVAGTCTGEENITGGNWAYGHERHTNYSPGGSMIVYVHEGETGQDVYKQVPRALVPPELPFQLTTTVADEEHTNWGELP